MIIDGPYTLGNYSEQDRRRKLALEGNHIQPLFSLIENIRTEQGEDVPLPDPLDGGVNARILFLLERPGPKAKGSGFISRNNPDPTAKNTFNFLKEAGIKREDTLLWNIIPWYGRVGGKFISPEDINNGIQYAKELVLLMPNLELIVFVGNKARRAMVEFEGIINHGVLLGTYFMYHTSNQSVHGGGDPKLEEIRKALKEIAEALSS